MRSKSGAGWKAAQDDAGRYFGEYGGCQDYHLYELTQEQFDRLEKGMTEGEAASVMRDGRHLYMSVNDRCGPPYTVVFDDDYAALCPWAEPVGSGRVWSADLTDAATELFASEENNRRQRREKRERRSKKG